MPRTGSEGYCSPANPKSLLARDLKEMDKSVKQMLKLIEEDGSDSFPNNSDVYQQKRPELIAHIESFCTVYQSMADRYDHLTEEEPKGVPSDQIQILGSGISDQDSPRTTPIDRHKYAHGAVGMEMSPSSGDGSSDPSLKGGSESFSSSSSDSESDSSLNNYLDSPMNTNGREHKMPMKNQFGSLEVNGDCIVVESKHGDYDESLGVVGRYEEELKVSKLELRRSEEEVAMLKIELEKNESIVLLKVDMRAQLEAAQRTIKAREADLDIEKRRGLQMQEQIALLETRVLDSNLKIKQLMEESEVERKNRKDLDKENAKLKKEVESKVLELQQNTVKHQAIVSERDHEIRELESALCDTHESFMNEKAQLQSEIDKLLQECTGFVAKLNEWELRSKSMEDKLKLSEVEKLEIKTSTDTLQFGLQGEINDLNAELVERDQHVESLNKTLDGFKLKYDMLMAEKDQANAKIGTLIAENSALDNQIRQMEDHIGHLRIQNVNAAADSENARKLSDELRSKVEELEKEVEMQNISISNGAEEKREAIRQLCFSLEHYRSGYKELRQAFVGQKRYTVMAS